MDEGGGFLARWARRKSQARSGVVEPDRPAPPPLPPAAVVAPPREAPALAPAAALTPAAAPAAEPSPPPTMDDVAALTPDADFGRFVARDVDPGVRNAAMKKLFSDPHYNVMDGLDIYIDDYGKPDPIPQSMLRGTAQSQLLGLFKDEGDDKPEAAHATTIDHASPTAESSAESSAEPDRTHDEDPDLQLQPDDAAGARAGEPGGSHAGGDPAGER
ncbi:DUF3306 domain-containing protein [Piscinibacter aquaticus]|uniref:DUF3306 domain-containing protein n=1 Tax=Piscinibacter aquaticus TaxID=392597 RepID=A0A5C6TZD3_9BURK|nr:DUF3306 domain-containing protein [Piscinibacter aquaticus]